MKYKANIEAIAALKPDYMGFIFSENSPRHMTEPLSEIPQGIKKVGVFVDTSLENVKKTTKAYGLDLVQLHGQESPEFCRELQNKVIKIIKVFYIKDTFDFGQLVPYESYVDYFLFDTKGPNPGGNGHCFDWSVLENYNLKTPYFLSGGIGFDKIKVLNEFRKSALAAHCHAIDVNSKFELKPAVKDPIKLKTFIQKL
ncbi:MAG: phosphoribosylanthranilate isomerase [Bacteroidota bacterium]|nr:phosphoribosylanthranilate isomerase [Bacteroidota bacterium]